PGRLHGSRMRRVLVGERPQVRLGVVGGAGRARRRGVAIPLRRGRAGGAPAVTGGGRRGAGGGAGRRLGRGGGGAVGGGGPGDWAGGSEGGWAAEGPESALVPAGSVLVSVGAPIQGRRRDVSPKATSRLRRAASGASGFGPGRRDASMYLPPRRRLRHEAEDGSVMRYILGSQLRILPHPAVRTSCRSCASAVDILGVCA